MKEKFVAFIDAEHALDPIYAQKARCRISIIYSALNLTQVNKHWKFVMHYLASGAVDVIVVDSVAALTPKAEIEGEIGDSHVGLAARMMSQSYA